MPEKKNTGPSYETIMRDLEARRFSPIYILMGEESYYIDKSVISTRISFLELMLRLRKS